MKASEIGLPTHEASVSCGQWCLGGTANMTPTTHAEHEDAEFVWVRGDVAGAALAALRAERDSLQKRVTECESVMLHYGMETEHSCMCQFANDTDAPTSECGYHEKIRTERDEAVALLRGMDLCSGCSLCDRIRAFLAPDSADGVEK